MVPDLFTNAPFRQTTKFIVRGRGNDPVWERAWQLSYLGEGVGVGKLVLIRQSLSFFGFLGKKASWGNVLAPKMAEKKGNGGGQCPNNYFRHSMGKSSFVSLP